MATLVSSFHFVSSYLWAPPVASQFSVLSQTFVKVRAPPVAILLFHLISSHHFSWHRLWQNSFLLFGHRQWRPLSFHHISSHHFSGHRQWRPFTHLHTHTFHLISSHHIYLGTACGDSVLFSVIQCVVCSGTISGDSFVSFEFIASFVWAPPVATQFSVLS